MFLHLTSRLRGEVATVQKALVMADGVRNLLTNLRASLLAVPPELSEGADDKSRAEYGLATLLPQEPSKRDWQIYDHCAALTRLYSVYEQFIGELVGEYVRLLPKLYVKYSDLPACVANQHRIGIGHILLNIGEKGPYKDLDEDLIRQTGLSVGLVDVKVCAISADWSALKFVYRLKDR